MLLMRLFPVGTAIVRLRVGVLHSFRITVLGRRGVMVRHAVTRV